MKLKHPVSTEPEGRRWAWALLAATLAVALTGGLPGVACAEDAQASADRSVPTGATAFFTLEAACPAGWAEPTKAAGRLIVGVTIGHEVGGTVGRALNNGENPQHSHGVSTQVTLAKRSLAALSSCCNRSAADNTSHNVVGTAKPETTALPFVQLLTCEKSALATAAAAEASTGGGER